MNNNNISFLRNASFGLTWGNYNSHIYDDNNLNIKPDDSMYISAPIQCMVTSPDLRVMGNLNVNNADSIVSHRNDYCYIECLSSSVEEKNWIHSIYVQHFMLRLTKCLQPR